MIARVYVGPSNGSDVTTKIKGIVNEKLSLRTIL